MTQQISEKLKQSSKDNSRFFLTQVDHGTMKGYRKGCRCEGCSGSAADERRIRFEKNRDYFKKFGVFLTDGVKHGTSSAYGYGCRCEACYTASRSARISSMKKQRDHLKLTGNFLGEITKHGTTTGYNYGCRCGLCIYAIYEAHDQSAIRRLGGLKTLREQLFDKLEVQFSSILVEMGVGVADLVRLYTRLNKAEKALNLKPSRWMLGDADGVHMYSNSLMKACLRNPMKLVKHTVNGLVRYEVIAIEGQDREEK